MTAREQRHERALEEDVLARDHAPDLVHRSLDRAVGGFAVAYGFDVSRVVHREVPLRMGGEAAEAG